VRRTALVALLIALAAPASATAAEPWRGASDVRDALFDAQTELIIGTPAVAERAVARGAKAYRGDLRAGIRAADPAADREARAALAAAAAAAREQDGTALAPRRAAGRDLPGIVRRDARRGRPR
jgi:hypothetical protein